MNKTLIRLNEMKSKTKGYWSNRITTELEYAFKVSKVNDCRFDTLIEEAVEFLFNKYSKENTITKTAALETENILKNISETAKSFKMICAAHAHIDMNWMWGFPETVALTLDTFRTMLNLMDEYPEYKFSQSQASVYKIVEEYDPNMLEEIKKRVKEGRWEVTASTWVETDKNMPNGESLARHILYTKKYLSTLLDINPDSLNIDFEPDTFGHNINVPEILNKGGVKYYYHCRGYDKHNIYNWQSPSGSSTLVYRDPFWYNADIDSKMVLHIPEFCSKHKLDTALKVYGVGDHGGGPTRKDIEKIIDMAKWPIFPEIRFGSFTEYFEILETIKDTLHVETKELNFIFTGCYTTQSRIKMANRISEAKLNETESYSCISSVFANGNYQGKRLEKAWENILFNHFHDILPGSGIIDTREYSMGLFQKTLAISNTETTMALRNIASLIDTSSLNIIEENISNTRSEGGGVGYGIMNFELPQTERGSGINRIFHFFNPSDSKRCEPVEIVVWDWDGNEKQIIFKDSNGTMVEHQILENKSIQFHNTRYWGHKYLRILINAAIPAYGFSTYTLSEIALTDIGTELAQDPRVQKLEKYILENNYLKAEFSSRNASLISLFDKCSNTELVSKNDTAGIFRLIEEDDNKGMTSWIIGRYMRVLNLNSIENVKILNLSSDPDSLKQWIEYEIRFRDSKLNVTISLLNNSSHLDFNITCDWQERAVKGKYIPQLNFFMPLNYNCMNYKYDIPFGTIKREDVDMDVPANSWALGIPENSDSNSVMLVTSSKYGFRGTDNSLSITLIRSSYDPDPYPENGIHNFRFAMYSIKNSTNFELIKKAYDYNHPITFLSGKKQKGTLPLQKSFINVESGNAVISAVKVPENNIANALIIRAYETEGSLTNMVISFSQKIKKAYYVDINEETIENNLNIYTKEQNIEFEISAFSVESVYIEFE